MKYAFLEQAYISEFLNWIESKIAVILQPNMSKVSLVGLLASYLLACNCGLKNGSNDLI